MRIAITKPLFAWDSLQDSPSLKTIREFLEVVPDGKLLESLHRWRGHGRNDYPVRVLWGVLLLTIVTRHTTIESCLGELRRNPSLRILIGIESEDGVPRKWNVSRFLKVLGEEPHLTLLMEVFDMMAARLSEVVPDLGKDTAGDASGLCARRERKAAAKKKRGRKRDDKAGKLPEPEGGRKEYTDDEGNVTKVVEWFGYKFHVVVDRKHEVAIAYRITSANTADNVAIPELVGQTESNLPKDRMETFAYDKAADDGKVHEFLYEKGIAPVVENRSMWKDEPERMLPGHDGNSNVVYDESGTIYCYDKVSDPPVRRRMAYLGYEKSKGTLKYRCPAKHGGFSCQSNRRCNEGKNYGKTIRVKCEIDLRRFPPIPRATKKFERLYKERTSVERVIGRLKVFWGADDGNIAGAMRFHAYLGAVMVVHLGLATLLAATPRREGTLGKMRLSPISRALGRKLEA